ncbi:MAG: tyrosine recombinase XerC [Clostridiales bacterium]|nr:tyrosine recombinase XerC [Clostridiales bacterium]
MDKFDYSDYPLIITKYLDYLIGVKNRSQLTVYNYATDLRMFFRFILYSRKLVPEDTEFDNIDISSVDIELIKTVTLDDAYKFLSFCRNERKNDSKARARKAVSIKRFFKYLTFNRLELEKNPMQELESPKIKKSLPKHLTLEQSKDLLKCVDGKNRERDYCILTLFLNCGLRLSELCGLDLSSIDTENNTMLVVGKGNKERTIYLNNACISALNNYLAVRPRDGVLDRSALFISRNKRRINPRSVENIVKHFLEKSGLGDMGFTVHKLRHTAATLMYQHGHVDVLLLKEILGHENLSTTEIYTHVYNEQLKEATDKNPLNSPPPDDL